VIGGDKECDDRPLNRPDDRDSFRAPSSRDYRDSSRRMSGSGSGGGLGTLASPSSTQWSNTYGLSPQFLDSIGITGPLANRIFVANVSFHIVHIPHTSSSTHIHRRKSEVVLSRPVSKCFWMSV